MQNEFQNFIEGGQYIIRVQLSRKNFNVCNIVYLEEVGFIFYFISD